MQQFNLRISRFIPQRIIPAEILLVTLAVGVGVSTGLGAVLFIKLLAQINSLSLSLQTALGSTAGLLVGMALAGLIVGFMVERWAVEAKGHGVPEVMEAVAVRGGRIRPRVAAIKVLASSITIGAGGSAGREGPIVQVGSTIGSSVAQWLRLPGEHVQTLVACGAAAGIAATFNAPIAGSIFALEVILGRFTIRHFGLVVLASVSGSVVSRIFLSDQPAFTVPAYPLNNLGELFVYFVLAVLSSILAVIIIRLLYAAEGIFDEWRISLTIKAALGMATTGTLALLLPEREILGPGLHLIGETISNEFDLPLGLMFALLGLKLLATVATLGTGNSGGVFAPSLFMGATLGGIVGTIGQMLWPEVVIHPGAYAIVGMAATFSGAARAPITAVLIVFEMSGDYKLILPLMMATVVSTLIAEKLFEESIYTLKLKLKGIQLQNGRDEDILGGLLVREVMNEAFESVTDTMTLAELSYRFSHSHHHGFPVLNKAERLVGIVTLSDMEEAIADNWPPETAVTAVCTPRHNLIIAHPDQTIGEALRQMGGIGLGRIPVVSRQEPDKIVGIIRRADIVNAYNVGLTRRAIVQQRIQQKQVQNLDGTEFIDLTIRPGDIACGQTIQALARCLPHDCVLVSVRRNGRLLIPHGDTQLQGDDQITAFLAHHERDTFITCLRGQVVISN
ncbi:MAG: chloride channel protein [Chloroflexota bacterium]